ncbi:hypothetical protein K438DRAFT_1754276 [Mycena galopus ATCC 62051]|nr:hypothetical protein K438DRAFT_1754276 [Mycena galopus ATCC 62051]
MIKSGELAKYPLAVVKELLNLRFLATYVEGMGLEDLEGCKRFSGSNVLAKLCRYASRFHRQQEITTYARHFNSFETYANLNKFLCNNYRQALEILKTEGALWTWMWQEKVDTVDRFHEWLLEERVYLEGLKDTAKTDEETLAMEYVQKLVNLSASQAKYQVAAMEAQRAPKTGKSVKNKYDKFKLQWDEVIKINNNSGWPSFNKVLGANIIPECASVWDDWVLKNPKAKPFRNTGFDFYNQFDIIVPLVSAIPRGRHVYHASQPSLSDLGVAGGPDGEQDSPVSDGEQDQPPAQWIPGSGRESPEWNLSLFDLNADFSQLSIPEADFALEQLNRKFAPAPPSEGDNPSEPDYIPSGTTNPHPSTPSQSISSASSSTGHKRGASETPLPTGRATEKKPKSRAPPTHTPLKPVSGKFGKMQDVFSKLDARMGDILSVMQTPEAPTVKDTPHRLSNAVHLARQEHVWLPRELLMSFTDLLETDRNVVVTYLMMESEPDVIYRRMWILWKLKVPIPAGYDLSQDILFPM